MPGIGKEGLEIESSFISDSTFNSTTTTTTSTLNPTPSESSPQNQRPGGTPLFPQPLSGPFLPEGPYLPGSYPPNSTSSSSSPFYNPYNVGDADLNPFAASPGLAGFGGGGRSPFGIGRGEYGGPFGGGDQGGGMIVGPGHPMFQGSPVGGGFGGGMAGFGLPGRGNPYPPGMVPPGARYDPIGPVGPSLGPFGGNRVGGGRGRGRGRGFGGAGDPDFDELPPPGYSDMFM